jgi:drug/metabolite transporter (DMT)-like permease
MGIVAAFVTLLCWTIGTFAFTFASQRADAGSVNRVRLMYATILLSIITPIFFHIDFIQLFTLPQPIHWLWLGLSGIIGLTIGDYFAFSAYRLMGSSRSSLFSSFAPVAALLLGMAVLNESLNLFGIIGICVSIAGILWFVKSSQKDTSPIAYSKQAIAKGSIYALLGAVGQGLGLVFSKLGLNESAHSDLVLSPVHATWIRISIACMAGYAMQLLKPNPFAEIKQLSSSASVMKPLLIGILFGPIIGVAVSLFTVTKIPVSIAQTIFSLQPLTVLFFASTLGKEKLSKQAILAAIISTIGVCILVWRDDF